MSTTPRRNNQQHHSTAPRSSLYRPAGSYNADQRVTGVYTAAVPKPTGFSYAHVWSGKPRAAQDADADSPLEQRRRRRQLREEMAAVRDEIGPHLDILDSALSQRLGSLITEPPKSKKAEQLQRQIIALLREDEKLKDAIFSGAASEDLHHHDDEDDDDEENEEHAKHQNQQQQHRNRDSASDYSGGDDNDDEEDDQCDDDLTPSDESSSESSHIGGDAQERRARQAARRKQRRQERRREAEERRRNHDPRSPEQRHEDKIKELLRSGKHVLKRDLRPRKPEAAADASSATAAEATASSSKIYFARDIDRGMRFPHGKPALYPYRVMSLPWNRARIVPPQQLVDGADTQPVTVVDDLTEQSAEVRDLRYKQQRSQRTRLEQHERHQRREIVALSMRGVEDIRYTFKRFRTEIVLRTSMLGGESDFTAAAPSTSTGSGARSPRHPPHSNGSGTGGVPTGASVRQRMYQSLLGEKRPFPPKPQRKAPATALRLCFLNAAHMSDDYMDTFVTVEGLVPQTRSGMVVDPAIQTMDIRPCVVVARSTANNPAAEGNTAEQKRKEADAAAAANKDTLELMAVDRDDPAGTVLGRAVVPCSVFARPTVDEVPLLQVDVPILPLDGGAGLKAKLLRQRQLHKEQQQRDPKRNSGNDDNDSADDEEEISRNSEGPIVECELICESHVSLLTSTSVPTLRLKNSASRNSHNSNNNNGNAAGAAEVQQWIGPARILLEVTLTDDGTADYAPVAAVRRSQHHERALPLKPPGASSPSTLLVALPRRSGGGALHVVRFDVGLFPKKTGKEEQKEQPQQQQDQDDEPVIISVDFDLLSIRDEKTGELAESVEIPVAEAVALQLKLTYLGPEIDIEVAAATNSEDQNIRSDSVAGSLPDQAVLTDSPSHSMGTAFGQSALSAGSGGGAPGSPQSPPRVQSGKFETGSAHATPVRQPVNDEY